MDTKSGEGGLNWETGVDRLGNPLQYSLLENPTAREAWQATVHGGRKSRTQLSDSTTITTYTTMHKIDN